MSSWPIEPQLWLRFSLKPHPHLLIAHRPWTGDRNALEDRDNVEWQFCFARWCHFLGENCQSLPVGLIPCANHYNKADNG